MISYSKIKRDEWGRCNICNLETKLTWDHVPPQGSIQLTSVKMKTLFETYHSETDSVKPIISQNGVKFRTLCQRCNNVLGTKYDNVLKEFSSNISIFLSALKKLYIPDVISIKTKPNSLIRCLIGHLLAAKIEPDTAPFDTLTRKIIFDETISIPNEINIFYWLYPYPSDILVIRDVVLPSKRGKYDNISVFQIIKFYPIAFLFTETQKYENLLSLNHYRSILPSLEIEIPLKVNQIFDPHWPERASDGNFTILSKGAFNSIRAESKK